MKKQDLKHGMVVKLRNGDYNIVCNNDLDEGSLKYFNTTTMATKMECRLCMFDNNMKHENSEIWDIIEVYSDMKVLFDDCIKPIWEGNDKFTQNVKKGDLVWVSDCEGNDKEWILREFDKIVNSNDCYKYRVKHIFEGCESESSWGYKYCRPAKKEDFQWFTDK